MAHTVYIRFTVFSNLCRTSCNFEKFENIGNLIYTVCAMSEMIISSMFAIVSMMRITGVEILHISSFSKFLLRRCASC